MLLKKNVEIIEEFRRRIARLGLDSILDIEPIENSSKTRQKYAKYKDGIMRFRVIMWQVNKLEGQELSDAIDEHIAKAIEYFQLQPKLA